MGGRTTRTPARVRFDPSSTQIWCMDRSSVNSRSIWVFPLELFFYPPFRLDKNEHARCGWVSRWRCPNFFSPKKEKQTYKKRAESECRAGQP
jgi:hypothetical protein